MAPVVGIDKPRSGALFPFPQVVGKGVVGFAVLKIGVVFSCVAFESGEV